MKRIQGKRPNQIPDSILNHPLLASKKQLLPSNYNFEIEKTLWRIQEVQARRIGLQFPEGLQMFACILSDIVKSLSEVEDCIILADIVFGACCVEDLTSSELGLDLLIHYGHSCLIPINETCMKTLYVFVDIQINVASLVETLCHNFSDPSRPVALVSTVQFVEGIYKAKQVLLEKGLSHFFIPQAKPRTTGELLGCTSPNIKEKVVVSVSDGRFHLEAAMIQNPDHEFYRFDPYLNSIFREEFDLHSMKTRRMESIIKARDARYFGLIMGTLGRQGSVHILKKLKDVCRESGKRVSVFLMSDVCQEAVDKFPQVEAWVEVACPRLAMDWGCEFKKPMLSPYECFVALKELPLEYPMDNYLYGGGPWSVYTAKGK